MKAIFIPSEKLGVLEPHFHEVTRLDLTKRQRAARVKGLARTLTFLGLVPDTEVVAGLSLGTNSNGEIGGFITFEQTLRSTPPQTN